MPEPHSGYSIPITCTHSEQHSSVQRLTRSKWRRNMKWCKQSSWAASPQRLDITRLWLLSWLEKWNLHKWRNTYTRLQQSSSVAFSAPVLTVEMYCHGLLDPGSVIGRCWGRDVYVCEGFMCWEQRIVLQDEYHTCHSLFTSLAVMSKVGPARLMGVWWGQFLITTFWSPLG